MLKKYFKTIKNNLPKLISDRRRGILMMNILFNIWVMISSCSTNQLNIK